MKGIILAGGSGSRLYPLTKAISKHLLPINDKPMIFYSLSVLMIARIKDILLITTKDDLPLYKKLLEGTDSLGLNIEYKIQDKPDGIAKSLIIGEDFIKDDSVCLILGDNIFYGYDLSEVLKKQSKSLKSGATIFGYHVSDPERFGVVSFDKKLKVETLEEKPAKPKSNYAVVGLYFYDNNAVNYAKSLKPSPRGELEITDLNKEYLKRGKLSVELFGKGFAWLDTGTHKSLLAASQFVNTIEERQGQKLGCIEEIAYQNGWITKKQLKNISSYYGDTDYGRYLRRVTNNK